MLSLKGFILFLKHPNAVEEIEILTFKLFFKLVWKSILILFSIDIILGLVISTPLRYFHLFPLEKEINNSVYIILKISLILPIIEELIFRLPLRISIRNLAISLSLVLFLIINKPNLYLACFLSILLFIILLFLLKKDSEIFNSINSLSTRYFSCFFYFQALIFGFLHLTNYNLDIQYFYLFPLFAISYVVAGCFLGYIRVRYNYGIYLCLTTHIVVNSLYCLILLK